MSTHLPSLRVVQRLALTSNRYDVLEVDGTGAPGALLATARQKRMALKERVTFFTDETESQEAFSLRARQRSDLGATYDITDADGTPLASLRKNFARSLLRSTFHLETVDGVEAVGVERHLAVALLRRFGELPLPISFDFRTTSGELALTSMRSMGVRDTYAVTVPAPSIDWRVAAAVATGLDALMSR